MNTRAYQNIRLETIDCSLFTKKQKRHAEKRALQNIARKKSSGKCMKSAFGDTLEKIGRIWIERNFPTTNDRLLYFMKSRGRIFMQEQTELDCVIGTSMRPEIFVEMKTSRSDKGIYGGVRQLNKSLRVAQIRWKQIKGIVLGFHLYPEQSEYQISPFSENFHDMLPLAQEVKEGILMLNIDAIDLWKWGKQEGLVKDWTLLHHAYDVQGEGKKEIEKKIEDENLLYIEDFIEEETYENDFSSLLKNALSLA